MRILMDLPDDQIAALTEIGARDHKSRAAVIRDAIAAYLAGRRRTEVKNTFGLWRREGQEVVDGLDYQKALRGEW